MTPDGEMCGVTDGGASSIRLLSGADIDRALGELDRRALKRFGQNFVVDPNLVRRIVSEAGITPQSRVVEIGPGLGSLTIPLVHHAQEVLAVELDGVLADRLEETVRAAGAVGRLTTMADDATSLRWATRLHGSADWLLVANLPYNVAARLVLDVVALVPAVARLVVMVQREVAQRLVAEPGSRGSSVATVRRALFADARVLFGVPPEVFSPRPRVHSSVVALSRVDRGLPPAVVDEVWSLAGRGFGQRRKTMRAALGASVPPAAFEAAGIDPGRRAETLTMTEWEHLGAAAVALSSAAPSDSASLPQRQVRP